MKAIFIILTLILLYYSPIISSKAIVCYYASWTTYRNGNGKFDATNVNPSLCTHINYGFVGYNQSTGEVQVLDTWEAFGLDGIANLIGLKKRNKNLKVLLSMGGWGEGSTKYSQMAADSSKRQTLIKSILEFVNTYDFDGFDFDWEYPGQRGGDEKNDPANFITFLSELKTALHADNKILTAAVSAGIATIDIAYNVKAISDNLDMINVMAYDYHGAFETYVGHYAPLYPSSLDKTKEQRQLNVAASIQHWLDLGADPSKINLGVGTYGRGFTLANPANNELYSTAYSGNSPGPYTGQDGIAGYNEICEFYSDWEYIWDDEQKVPHILSGNQWIGFDDERSIGLKVDFANKLGLGGIMVWSLDTDDFRGICGEPYPLLRVINQKLNN